MTWNSRVLQNGSVILLEETPLANIWRLIAWPPKPLGNVDSQYRTVLSKLVRSPGLLLIKTTNCSKNSLQMKGLDRSHSDRLDTNDLIHQTVQMVDIPRCLLQRIQERLHGGYRDPTAAYAKKTEPPISSYHLLDLFHYMMNLRNTTEREGTLWGRIFHILLISICLRAHDAGREMILPESVARFTEPSLDSHQPRTPRQHS